VVQTNCINIPKDLVELNLVNLRSLVRRWVVRVANCLSFRSLHHLGAERIVGTLFDVDAGRCAATLPTVKEQTNVSSSSSLESNKLSEQMVNKNFVHTHLFHVSIRKND
jgi:hypothetical protein